MVDLALPFRAGRTVRVLTYPGHGVRQSAPYHIPTGYLCDVYRGGADMVNVNVIASAPGVITQHFDPGGIEIRHVDGIITRYMHMRVRAAVGTLVDYGTAIGKPGN